MPLETARVRAPELEGEWLEGPGLSMAQLRGRAVLVDFWDYTCVNCLRTLPYVREWDRRYRGRGLTIIGVHAPEFTFARSADHVRRAVEQFGIGYPVLLDNDFRTWQAFANRAWPSKYLVDKDGYIRYSHTGEGAYQETELAIQDVLLEIDPGVQLPVPMEPVRAIDAPGVALVCERPTPEVYMGDQRGRIAGAQPDIPELAGEWTVTPEYAEGAAGAGGAPPSVRLQYSAAEVNAVMAPAENGPAEVDLFENGLAVDHQSRGEDLREAADGRTCVLVTAPRMYSLIVRTRYLHSRVLELAVRAGGVRIYSFTFVSCAPRP